MQFESNGIDARQSPSIVSKENAKRFKRLFTDALHDESYIAQHAITTTSPSSRRPVVIGTAGSTVPHTGGNISKSPWFRIRRRSSLPLSSTDGNSSSRMFRATSPLMKFVHESPPNTDIR